MASESARDKATRYLAEGRVIIEQVRPDLVVATVRGEGAIYTVSWAGEWKCSCPHQATSTFCSHIHALRRVTAADIAGG